MVRIMRKWTVTAPQGQILIGDYDNLEPTIVMMSSQKGNHGSVLYDTWLKKVEEMRAAGYTVTLTEKKSN